MSHKQKNYSFNTLIEGTYHDEWSFFHYKMANLEIKEDIIIINDGIYKYFLYAKRKDYRKLDKKVSKENIEQKLNFLGFCDGLVLPVSGQLPNFLERPRTLILRDGRVFIDDHMMDDQNYLKALEDIAKKRAKEIFSNTKYESLYQELVI